MPLTRRALTVVLSLMGPSALYVSLPQLVSSAAAQGASDVLKPVALPDMALGPADARVTVIEYASMTCTHCAEFNREAFPKIKSEFIDTGKIRYVFREFPIDIKAAAGSMLARAVAKDDPAKYFAVVDLMFRQQDRLFENTRETLTLIGREAGMTQQAVEACLADQALLDKLKDGRKYAADVLKVDGTPAFFINGQRYRVSTSFDEIGSKIRSLLKG